MKFKDILWFLNIQAITILWMLFAMVLLTGFAKTVFLFIFLDCVWLLLLLYVKKVEDYEEYMDKIDIQHDLDNKGYIMVGQA